MNTREKSGHLTAIVAVLGLVFSGCVAGALEPVPSLTQPVPTTTPTPCATPEATSTSPGWTSHSIGRVSSVVVTADGTAWFGSSDASDCTSRYGRCSGGLWRFDGQSWQHLFEDRGVTALAVHPDGSLWVGLGGPSGIMRFDGQEWEDTSFEFRTCTGIPVDFASALDGTTWVALVTDLCSYDGQSWRDDEGNAFSLGLASDGALWSIGWPPDVRRFDGTGWATYAAPDGYTLGFRADLAVTPGGLACVVTDSRLDCIDSSTDPARASKSWVSSGVVDGHDLGGVNGMAIAPDGTLWVAADRGVARFDETASPDQSWASYTTADGLLSKSVQGIAAAPDGTVWACLENGVARFEEDGDAKGVWISYATESDLTCDSKTIAFAPDGSIWFGTARFQPAEGDDTLSAE